MFTHILPAFMKRTNICWIIGFFLFVLFLSGCSERLSNDAVTLIIQSQEDGEIYRSLEVHPGDVIELSWIHSVEKTPWSEVYEIGDNENFYLIETRFESFGAGVPHEKGTMKVENGEVVVRDIHKEHEAIRWFHSQQVQFTLRFGDEDIIHSDDIPHHERVEMIVKER